MTDKRDADDFKRLSDALRALSGNALVFATARAGIEAAMDEWLTPIRFGQVSIKPAIEALCAISSDHLEMAVLDTGPAPLTRLYRMCRPHAAGITLRVGALKVLPTEALDRLVSDGYVYAPKGALAAETWLIHGARHGEAGFRASHPRKSPVIAYWEDAGLTLPAQGLSPDGRDLMISEISRMKRGALTAAIDTTMRNRPRSDWRVVFCLMLREINLPPSMDMRLNALFGRERKNAILALLRPAVSSHGELERIQRLREMPTIGEILDMEGKPDVLDRYLEPQRAA